MAVSLDTFFKKTSFGGNTFAWGTKTRYSNGV